MVDFKDISKEPGEVFSKRFLLGSTQFLELIFIGVLAILTILDFSPTETFKKLNYAQAPHIFSWALVFTVSESGNRDSLFVVYFIVLYALIIIDTIAMAWKLVIMISIHNLTLTMEILGWVMFAFSILLWLVTIINVFVSQALFANIKEYFQNLEGLYHYSEINTIKPVRRNRKKKAIKQP